jgi:FkbM family methyltransferase
MFSDLIGAYLPRFAYDYIPLVASIFPLRFINGSDSYNGVLGTIRFWKRYSKEFEFHGNRVSLKDLDWKCPIRDALVAPLSVYFRERKNYQFQNVRGKICMNVGGHSFVLPFPFGITEIVETWTEECYGCFDLNNKTVVDVGAFIGDSAVYFASKGARQVVGFEPSKEVYKLALENVKLNGYESKIDLRNAAVGVDNGVENFAFDMKWPGRSSLTTVKARSKTVVYQTKVTSFETLIDELRHIGLLKMDCEGAEHRIIPDACEKGYIKNIDSIILEIHGSPHLLLSALEKAGFNTVKFCENYATTYLLAASRVQKTKVISG